MLALDRARGLLGDGAGRRFLPADRRWAHGAVAGEPVEAAAAVRWLQGESGHPLRIPIGVIGPREAPAQRLAIAEAIGAALGGMGLAVVCGGRQGVMEAVCRGAAEKGGLTIGLLPEPDASAANPYVRVPIATGIGEARNAIVARAAFCLVVVGDSYGTLSEVALGLQFGKPVLGIDGAADVKGVRHFDAVPPLAAAVARLVLALPLDA